MLGKVTVSLFGGELLLPLDMATSMALEEEGLDCFTLTMKAARKGQPLLLGPGQAARIIAIAEGHKGKALEARSLAIWERSRKEGAAMLVRAATDYIVQMLADADQEDDGEHDGEDPEDPKAKSPGAGSGPAT